MSRPLSDTAWRCIVSARGAVRGKAFHMRADTLAALLRERGDYTSALRSVPRHMLVGRRVYGVLVILDPLMRFGEVRLK